ncbi:hypothetical protein J2S43_007850 [Catenuloplanes nepalensis]|uniref:Uncharacterized protein n=1 Tax=Catenuloplanes nepalensis TaxID=587533 RepID=A0ABT9N717_9ACTN|nr:hypothetical protein [Catenuloplanes nepalensis]MDP9799338.1 hypothetical protein [Catenuloplanes nepalensis]
MGGRPLIVASGRHPFEVCTLLAAFIVGTALHLGAVVPRSVSTAMPPTIQAVWAIGLIVAGLAGLAGVAVPRRRLLVGLGLELLGIGVLGTAATMYSISLYAVSAEQAIVAGGFVSALAVASWWRWGQIIVDLRRLGRAAEAGMTVEVPLLVDGDR